MYTFISERLYFNRPDLSVQGESANATLLLSMLTALMGGYEGARFLHFGAMALLVFIVLVHVLMVLLVPRTFPTMITGRLRRTS